ncbi:DUF2975 domain-containing protein [Peptoniphilaceae bacterium SGI.131]
MERSLKKLKYLAYILMIVLFFIGFIFSTYAGFKLVDGDKKLYLAQAVWTLSIYIVFTLILLGIRDIVRVLNNIEEGNIFKDQTVVLLEKIDNKLVINSIFSFLINVIMFFFGTHHIIFLIVWMIFVSFLVVCHLVVKPLILIVKKSVELQLEMELTV